MTDITSRGFLADLPAFDTAPDIVDRLYAACMYAAEARAALAAGAAEIELLRAAVAQQQAELDALRAEPVQRPAARTLRDGEVMNLYLEFDRTADKAWPSAEYLARFGLFVSQRTVAPQQAHPWIACSERMPEGPADVWVYRVSDDGYPPFQERATWNGDWHHSSFPGRVTHWMPLPAPPGEEGA